MILLRDCLDNLPKDWNPISDPYSIVARILVCAAGPSHVWAGKGHHPAGPDSLTVGLSPWPYFALEFTVWLHLPSKFPFPLRCLVQDKTYSSSCSDIV